MSEVSESDGFAPALAINEGVARVTLRRPQQHNRLAPSDIPVLAAHIETIRHNTGVRGLVSMAWAICGTKEGASPREVAVSEQYFSKLRRDMP